MTKQEACQEVDDIIRKIDEITAVIERIVAIREFMNWLLDLLTLLWPGGPPIWAVPPAGEPADQAVLDWWNAFKNGWSQSPACQ